MVGADSHHAPQSLLRLLALGRSMHPLFGCYTFRLVTYNLKTCLPSSIKHVRDPCSKHVTGILMVSVRHMGQIGQSRPAASQTLLTMSSRWSWTSTEISPGSTRLACPSIYQHISTHATFCVGLLTGALFTASGQSPPERCPTRVPSLVSTNTLGCLAAPEPQLSALQAGASSTVMAAAF